MTIPQMEQKTILIIDGLIISKSEEHKTSKTSYKMLTPPWMR